MKYDPAPMTEEQVKLRALDHQLNVLRSRHETLGAAYRDACEELTRLRKNNEELTRLRKENEDYRARLHAVRVLCEVPAP